MTFRRLLICGCARSGNTVMLHLCATGFEDTRMLTEPGGGEVVPLREDLQNDTEVLVGKVPKRITKLDKLLRDDDFGVIYMMRDPRDVLVSEHYLKPEANWVKPKRWIDAARIADELRDHPQVLLVRYERLVTEPNAVQQQLADTFGLRVLRPFDVCHQHFDTSDTPNINAMKGARPFDPSRIGNWRGDPGKLEYIDKLLQKHKALPQYMQAFGYA